MGKLFKTIRFYVLSFYYRLTNPFRKTKILVSRGTTQAGGLVYINSDDTVETVDGWPRPIGISLGGNTYIQHGKIDLGEVPQELADYYLADKRSPVKISLSDWVIKPESLRVYPQNENGEPLYLGTIHLPADEYPNIWHRTILGQFPMTGELADDDNANDAESEKDK